MDPFLASFKDRLGRAPLWIDCERYVERVFAGSPSDWHSNPQRFAGAMAQAHGLTRSDVVAVPGLATVFADPGWYTETGAAARALDAALKRPQPRVFLDEVLASLAHRLAGKAALVLELPSPGELLTARGIAAPHRFDDLDDVAAVLVALVRELSRQPVEALVCVSNAADGLCDDEREVCAPLFKAARYYGWGVVVRLDQAAGVAVPSSNLELIGARLLGALPPQIWYDDSVDIPPAVAWRFGTIPADAAPERVARRLRELTS